MQGISNAPTPPDHHRQSPLVITSALLVLLGAGGSLLTRVYFVQGGQCLWLSTLIQVSAWPLLLPPICIVSLLLRRSRSTAAADDDDHLLLPLRLVGAVAVLGIFFALGCYAYSLGSQALPLTTSSLLQATQLAFNALSAFVFAGTRFTPFSVNAVVLLTVGPAVLGVVPSSSSSDSESLSGDGSSSSSRTAYWAGFTECLASAALLGLAVPLFEVAMARYGCRRTLTTGPGDGASSRVLPPSYLTVMQVQAVMGAAGTVLCLVGMAVTKEFEAMPREAAAFGLGETEYYLVLVFGTVCWQLCNMGIMGLVASSSSLLAGIMVALLLPLSEVLAVVFLHEKLDGGKGVALVLCLWGFVSYLYGESAQARKRKKKVTKINEDPESVCCPLLITTTCN